MGQTEYTGNFVENIFASLRQVANSLAKIMQSGGNTGSGALSWFASNWLKLVLILIVVGIVADWLVWMIRWRPYWLWFRKKRVLLDDEREADYDPYERPRARRQYHSEARPRGASQRNRYARPDEEDEFFETVDPEDDEEDEDDYFIDEIEPDDAADGFDELLRNALVADEEEPPDGYEYEDEKEEDDPFEEEGLDEFFEYSEPVELKPGPLVEYAPPEPIAPAGEGESPWRTGYTVRVPKIDADSMELSRKMRRRLKATQSDDID